MISESRGGAGRLRMALDRASETERTAEIRRQASRIPQRCEGVFDKVAVSAVFTSFQTPGSLSSTGIGENWLRSESRLGAMARYSGLPTKNMTCCGGVALRMSSQNLSRGALA